MTVDIPTRAPEYAPSDDRHGRRGGPAPRFGRSRSIVGKPPIVVGGQPRANLLPPEIILKRKQLKTRRALRFGVLLVALAVVAGCIGSWTVASVAQVQVGIAQQTQAELVAKQAEYSGVRDVQSTIATIQAGQLVGGSTEIGWKDYLVKLQATLPVGVVLDTVSIDSGTPMSAFSQSDAPLQGDRVAALSFTATSATLPTIPDWLRSLAKLPGFVDAIPGSVKQENGVYSAAVLMHINSEAFSMRFDPAHIAAAEAQAAADAAAAAISHEPKSLTGPVVQDGTGTDGTTDGEGN